MTWRDGVLAFLTAPVSPETFLAEHYEKAPLVGLHGEPERFASLLTLARVDRFLAEADLRGNMVRLANHHSPVPEESYVDEDGRIDATAVAREYGGGSTIVLNELHDWIPELGAFCRAVEEAFSSHVTTNVYLTPAGNQGFPPHYDNHDVFVMQVSGRKLWRLWETPVETPYRGERFEQSGFVAGRVSREFVLEPGDCAYIPRGAMHDAENVGDAPSLHITVGLFTKKWAELVLEAVSELALAEADFRRSLPPGFATRDFDRAAAEAQTGRTNSDPGDVRGNGRTGVTNSDSGDQAGFGRTGRTNNDPTDRPGFGRGTGGGTARRGGCATGVTNSDPTDRRGNGRNGVSNNDPTDRAGYGCRR